MRDDKTMDPFETVVAELFGESVDPREMWDVISKQNDASEMHVNTAKAKREKREAQIGLASNVVGLAAGGAALVGAARNPALRRVIPEAYKGGPVTARAGKYLKTAEGRARLYRAGAGGAVALQAVNTGGDIVANRVLGREAKKEVKKALDDIVAARRAGRIGTDDAIAMAEALVEGVSKTATVDSDQIHAAVDTIAGALPGKKAQLAVTGAKQGKKAMETAGKVVTTGRKGIALARKAKPAPITASEAEPVMKSDGPQITWSGEIAKMDSSKRQVFGFAMVTHIDGEPVVDRQGDYTPLEEIEKAAYTYVIESRKGGDMHARDGDQPLHTSDLVESFVITPEKLEQMGLDENALPHGWWVGFKVNDDQQWADVVAKKRTAFSIHGSGRRVEKTLMDDGSTY